MPQPNPEIPKPMPLQMKEVRVTNPLIPGPGLQIPDHRTLQLSQTDHQIIKPSNHQTVPDPKTPRRRTTRH